MTALLLLALGYSGWANYQSHLKYECKKYTVSVKEIGMCDWKGYCKVRYSNNTLDTMDRPIVGQKKIKYKCN